MPPVTHTKKPGPSTSFRRRAGHANIIAALALMAALARSGTETQGGSTKNPPPAIRSAALAASAGSRRAS